jgi:hypothetical protein
MPENFYDLFIEKETGLWIAHICAFIVYSIKENRNGKFELFVNEKRLPALTEFESLKSAKRMASTIHMQVSERLNSIYLGKD